VENCRSIEGLGISLDEAALCQPMSIAVHNVSRAGSVDGQTVLVQGAGGIGAFLVYALVAAGADVIASDMDPDRLKIAAELGAGATVLAAGSPDDAARIADAVAGRELRAIFEVSGSAASLRVALDLAPKGCRVVLVGIQKNPLEIDLARITLDEISLIGTNALVRETDFGPAIDLIARRRGKWSNIAPTVVPMVPGLIDEALLPMKEGRARAIKTLVDPRGTSLRSMNTEPESAH
jgi:(R,R)-butanediol dehydrogenase/meso-butanediol dehydrogenase/diacetyl reductase